MLLILFVASSWAMKLQVDINPLEEQPGDHSGSDLPTGNTAPPLVESGDAAADKGFRQLRRLRSSQSISMGR